MESWASLGLLNYCMVHLEVLQNLTRSLEDPSMLNYTCDNLANEILVHTSQFYIIYQRVFATVGLYST